MPCDFVDGSGNLDTVALIANAQHAASQDAYTRFPQDVADGTVNHIMIDNEWTVPHDSLWGWYYQTQSKFKAPGLSDPYEKAITDTLGVTREQYNAIQRIHWKHFAATLKQINPNYKLGFYALPAMNRRQRPHMDKVRYQAPGTIMPDTVFNHIMDHFLGLNDIDVLFHQNYVNLKLKFTPQKNPLDIRLFTVRNALSNEQKFHNDPRTINKPFAVGFWLAHWQWDVAYNDKMALFEETLDSLAQNGFYKIWLSSGSWNRDGTPAGLVEQLNNAGVPIDSFWNDVSQACQNTIFQGVTCTQLTPGQKNDPNEGFSIEERSAGFSMEVFPNPLRDATTIRWKSGEARHTMLEVYNALGDKVTTLVNGPREAGVHAVDFRPGPLAPGVYYAHLRFGNHTVAKKKMIIMN